MQRVWGSIPNGVALLSSVVWSSLMKTNPGYKTDRLPKTSWSRFPITDGGKINRHVVPPRGWRPGKAPRVANTFSNLILNSSALGISWHPIHHLSEHLVMSAGDRDGDSSSCVKIIHPELYYRTHLACCVTSGSGHVEPRNVSGTSTQRACSGSSLWYSPYQCPVNYCKICSCCCWCWRLILIN